MHLTLKAALGALLFGSALLAMPHGTAEAATLPVPDIPAINPSAAGDGRVELAQSREDRRRQWRYDRRSHGDRFRYPYRKWRYYYNGYYYQRPYWNFVIPFGYGYGPGVYYYDDYDYDYDYSPRYLSNRHVRWCLNRYRSYNPRTNTWIAYSGAVRQCISPYGP